MQRKECKELESFQTNNEKTITHLAKVLASNSSCPSEPGIFLLQVKYLHNIWSLSINQYVRFIRHYSKMT